MSVSTAPTELHDLGGAGNVEQTSELDVKHPAQVIVFDNELNPVNNAPGKGRKPNLYQNSVDVMSSRRQSRKGDSTHQGKHIQGLRRFTVPQKTAYARALREITAGKKESCWMWFIIPTPPYVVKGVEMGSSRNKHYALRDEEEALAYLAFEADGVSLRNNYLGIMTAVRDKLSAGIRVSSLVGPIDEPKLRSSAKFFERVTRRNGDDEVNTVTKDVLRLLGEKVAE